MRARKAPPITPFAYSAKQLVDMGGIGCRQTIDNLIKQGELEEYHQGRAKWVTAESVERYKAKRLAIARREDSAPTPAHRRSRKSSPKPAAAPPLS